MQKIVDMVAGWLSGNKMYLVAIILAVLAILEANGIVIPDYVYQILGAFGIVAARSAMKKFEPVKPPDDVGVK